MIYYNKCRCCGNENLNPWLSLPPSPVANALFTTPDFERYPLDLNYCNRCGHMQLVSAPDPDAVFSAYRYKSGVSASFRSHFEQYAVDIHNTCGIGEGSKILEIGSNDGYLLYQFKLMYGSEVIGVEPSEFLVQDHTDKGVDVVTDFFTTNLVEQKGWAGSFDAILANNVLAHIPDTFDVMQGIANALKPGGILVAECGHQTGITSGEYLDNVYHEHIDYYSPESFSRLLSRVGLATILVETKNTHGMSFRIIARKVESNIYRSDVHGNQPFEEHLARVIDYISARETRIKNALGDRPFVAYGAAAKAVTMLYSLSLVSDKLIGVVDDNELKQNHYFPGTNILITDPATLDPDALILVTAWNVYDDIKAKLEARGHKGEILCMR